MSNWSGPVLSIFQQHFQWNNVVMCHRTCKMSTLRKYFHSRKQRQPSMTELQVLVLLKIIAKETN